MHKQDKSPCIRNLQAIGKRLADWWHLFRRKKYFLPVCIGCGVILAASILLPIVTAHTHSFGAWTQTKEPTCLEAGEETRTCSCGLTETRPLEALGHSEVVDPAVWETCFTDGCTEGSHCARCKVVLCAQTVLPARAPSEGLQYTSNEDGTCTLSGIGTCTDETLNIPGTSPDGERVTAIAEFVLYGNHTLKHLYLDEGIETIKGYAFYQCDSLETVLCRSVREIQVNAFAGCSALTTMTLQAELQVLESGAFFGCTNLCGFCPSEHTQISASPFGGCKGLADENGFVCFGGTLYAYVGSAEEISVPAKIRYIQNGAFWLNKTITTLRLPEGLTAIGEDAFGECWNLSAVFLPSTLENVHTSAFAGCPSLSQIFLGEGCQAFTLQDGCLIDTRTKTLVLGMADSIIPADGQVEHIADNAFYARTGLKDLVIPETVRTIGHGAFAKCSDLETIVLPEGLTVIPKNAFFACNALRCVTIPQSVTEIDACAFLDCSSLQSVLLPSSLQTIQDSAFAYCCALTEIVLPEAVHSVGLSLFSECTALTDITLPQTLGSLPDQFLYNCIHLQTIRYGGTQDAWNALPKGAEWDCGFDYETFESIDIPYTVCYQ